MKRIFLTLCTLASVLFIPALSFAEKVMFFTPTRVQLDDQKKVEVMNITNLSDITRTYKISFADQVMTYEGVTTTVDNFDYSAKRMLRFVPREFTLGPGQRQTVRIMSRVRPDTADGEYHTHIRFLEDVSKRNENNPRAPGQAATIAAPLAYEALIPAIVSHGNIQTNIDLKDAKVSKNPSNGAYKIDLTLTRQGNGQGIALIDTDYIAPNGQTVTATPRRTVYIYREIDERIKDYEFKLPEGAAPGGNLRIKLFDSNNPQAETVKELTLSLP